jgi:desulfoferrodoxin-like iron-binding protein
MGAVRYIFYRRKACGNVVFVLEGGRSEPVCCGENLKRLTSDKAMVFAQRMPKPGSL